MPTTKLRAVLLDRDGVLNVKADEGDYIRKPVDLRLLEGSAEAIGRLNRAGLLALVVSNQRGLTRGLMSAADLDAVHRELAAQLATAHAHLDGIYVCPHGYEDACDCRKPKPGLLLRAMREHGLAPDECVMIGDRPSDVGAAKAAGVSSVLIAPPDVACEPAPDRRADSLGAAVEWLLGKRT
jgi:D-glycero-D-manno-heptose 1,7-bisphosphate phosphatase